jgi:hypothetical protein
MIRRLLWLLAVLTVLSAGVVTTGCEYDPGCGPYVLDCNIYG